MAKQKAQPRRSPSARKPRSARTLRRQFGARGKRVEGPLGADERRRAILTAALHLFSQRGFAATRQEDIAARAGVAKGTLYLYYSSKQAMFEALIRSYVVPVLDKLESAAASTTPLPLVLERLFTLFRTEVLATERKLILQLLIAEGPRFPALAKFYHREVVARGMKLVGGLARQARQRGELRSNALERFPQLVVAPLIVSVVWDSLFSRLEPLDVDGLLDAYAGLLIAGNTAP